MAASLSTAQDARGDLNLGALIAGKVKSSLAMSAEERKAREEEIKLLKDKVDNGKATQEEIVRLDQLESQDKERKEGGIRKSFFAKAMLSEFGGDRRRRLAGTFSKNPDDTQDPSLTKQQRFAALLDKAARPAAPPPAPATPVATDDIGPMDYGDGNAQTPTPQQGSLEKLLEIIRSQKNRTNNELSRINGVLETFKQYFNKDNELKEKENQIERDKVELELDKEQDAKVGAESAALAGQIDNAGFADTETLDEQNEGKKDNGFLGGLMKTVGGMFNMFKGGGNKGATQYTKPIGPQPMNSKTPWASKGAGDRGGMFGGAGFTPRMPSSPTTPTPLNKGGIVPPAPNQKPTKMAGGSFITDRPTQTRLAPGSSVIPLNRNNSLGKMFQQAGEATGSKEADPMTKVMQLPTQVGGGLLLTALNNVMGKLGGLGSMLRGPIKQIATPVADMFGLPATVIGGLFGGAPAQAATRDPMKNRGGGFLDKLKGLFGKRSGGGGTPPPAVGGVNLGATMRAGETIQAESMEGPGGFYQGGSGLGSEGGQNTNQGYATHWHLGPPTNDAAGWAEARAVAKTSAQMMLARGSTIWFGNLKQFANPANLDAQIAAEQQAHSRPGRTQGGIDMQEKAPDGNMRLKFPLKVTNVTNDIRSGSGRTARVQGSNVVLAHGAVGSANSIESSVMPTTANGRQQVPFTASANGRQQQADPDRQTTGLTVTPEMQQAAPELMKLLVTQNQRQQAAPKQQVGPTGLSSAIGTTDPTGIDTSFWYRP